MPPADLAPRSIIDGEHLALLPFVESDTQPLEERRDDLLYLHGSPLGAGEEEPLSSGRIVPQNAYMRGDERLDHVLLKQVAPVLGLLAGLAIDLDQIEQAELDRMGVEVIGRSDELSEPKGTDFRV